MSSTTTPRDHISTSQVRRARARLSSPTRPTRRSRATEAVINQWLLEQSDRSARPVSSGSRRRPV